MTLLHLDKYLTNRSLIKAAPKMSENQHIYLDNKIISLGENNETLLNLIKNYISRCKNNWSKFNCNFDYKWLENVLDQFAVELLLKAQRIGIEKLLLSTNKDPFFEKILKEFKPAENRYPLVLVPSKLKKMKVEMEEISGDLASEVKTIPLSNTMDLVDHVK